MYSFCSSQINLPVLYQMSALRCGLKIPDGDMAYMKGRENEPHITVKYGLSNVNPNTVRDLVKDLPFFSIKFGTYDIFPSRGDGDVLYVSIADSIGAGGLSNLRRRLDEFSDEGAGEWAKYTPHMTVAYVIPGSCDYLKGTPCELTGQFLDVSSFLFCERNGNQHECSLSAPKIIEKPKALYDLYNGNQGI